MTQRKVWFNSSNSGKRGSNDFILNVIDHKQSLRILDFGCGIGITAYTFAEKGHDVTALDIRGTEPLEFLKWRTTKNKVAMRFIESEGGPPVLKQQYDVIVAMDSIEHIAKWRETVVALAGALNPNGVLFSNNGVMDDREHAEHYDIDNDEFIDVCRKNGLRPFNDITFRKRETKKKDIKEDLQYAESANY